MPSLEQWAKILPYPTTEPLHLHEEIKLSQQRIAERKSVSFNEFSKQIHISSKIL